MPQNQLPSELLNISGLADGYVFAGLVGTPINVNPSIPSGTTTMTLVQKPSGSAATMTAGVFTPDLPGVYLTTTLNATQTRPITFYAFATAVTAQKVGISQNTVNLGHLQALVAGAGALASGGTNALRTTLESAAPNNLAVNWSAFGN